MSKKWHKTLLAMILLQAMTQWKLKFISIQQQAGTMLATVTTYFFVENLNDYIFDCKTCHHCW